MRREATHACLNGLATGFAAARQAVAVETFSIRCCIAAVKASGGELKACQLGIQATLAHQFGVRTLGDNAARVHDDDPVGFLNGREAVRDD
jgi:hypothetical protein